MKQTIEEQVNYKFETIDQLAKQYVENFIRLSEDAFGKDEMTDGEKPTLELLKALYKNYKDYNEIKNFSYNDFLDLMKEKN